MQQLYSHGPLAPLLIVLLGITAFPVAQAAERIEAVTFAAAPDEYYLPLEEAAQALGWEHAADHEGNGTRLNKVVLPPESFRTLPDGTLLAPLSSLEQAGAEITRDDSEKTLLLRSGRRALSVASGAQSVEIDLRQQRLRARQGERLVLETRISSGRNNGTPRGDFRAGPYKAERHFSSKYDNAPMPWSVQVTGHIFIHGFTSVPDYPASRGCIRLPLGENNPARFFYQWVEIGTPITIR